MDTVCVVEIPGLGQHEDVPLTAIAPDADEDAAEMLLRGDPMMQHPWEHWEVGARGTQRRREPRRRVKVVHLVGAPFLLPETCGAVLLSDDTMPGNSSLGASKQAVHCFVDTDSNRSRSAAPCAQLARDNPTALVGQTITLLPESKGARWERERASERLEIDDTETAAFRRWVRSVGCATGVKATVLSHVAPLNKWILQTSTSLRDDDDHSYEDLFRYHSRPPVRRHHPGGMQGLHMVDLSLLSFTCEGSSCPIESVAMIAPLGTNLLQCLTCALSPLPCPSCVPYIVLAAALLFSPQLLC
jgi:hypothetical protein